MMVAMFTAILVNGQTYFWESFDAGQMPPEGWSIDALAAQWSVANSSAAGGLAPEGKFSYVQQNTTTRLISPVVDLTGLTTVKFSFRYFYDWYSNPAPKVGVATRSNNGSWNMVWESTPTGNVGPKQINLDINNTDVGQAQFQVCVYLAGNMYNLDYFHVDDMLLFNPLNNDAGLISLSLTPAYFSSPIDVEGTIMCFGNTTINNAEMQWQLNDGPVYTSYVGGLNLTLQQSIDFSCTDLLDAPIGAHSLKVWINKINGSPDDFRGNDTLTKTLYKICHVTSIRPVFEEFTSSTCGPCASFNSGFVPWCTSHEEDITLVKYQMNWPGSGDPYYTAEGGVRRTYYGVSAVPDLYCQGGNVATSMGEVQNAYDMAIQEIGMMKIAATHHLDNHTITLNASILPFTDIPGCRVHIVVMEKVTHNNARSNGETDFHHVMMKMVPNAEGTTVDLTDRVPFNVNETVDLTGTNVEEWDDLIVAVFVQHQASKKIYQSAYSVEDGIFAAEARLASLVYDDEPVPGFSPDTFAYEIRLPTGTTVIPTIAAEPMDTNATVIIIPAYELPGSGTVDVFAENLTTHNTYTVNFLVGGVGTGAIPPPQVSIYPNPARGILNIRNARGAALQITSANGTIVRTIPSFKGNTIDINDLHPGLYLLSIERTDGSVIRKKVVVY